MSEKKGNFFVNRPIVAFVMSIMVVIVGILSMLSLPIEQYPNLTPPIVQVKTTYVGANAVDVEQTVATPIEQKINGVDNMIYMKSTNANDGSMSIDVSFDVGTDPDMNTVFTQNKVSSATAKIPNEVSRFGVTTEKSLPSLLMIVTISTDDNRYDQNFLGNYSLINIQDELARTKGIGRVNIIGASDYSMRIWIKPDKLANLGITIPEVLNAIKDQNIVVPGGKFGAEPAPVNTEYTYTVKLPERFNSEEDFAEIVVRTDDDGAQVKLKDIARIELGVEMYNAFTRVNKNECALIGLYQSPGSNAVELVDQIKEKMKVLSKNFPEGMKYDIALDSAKPIVAGIQGVISNLIVALILVILVVFIFIQDWRATLIPSLAIPVSLIGAFAVFPMLGFTINVLSLLGLVLAIGIVVDDAIVVVETVQVNISKGMNSKQATVEAMRVVTGPVIATTLVLVAVFIPVAMMGGISGIMYKQFAITVVISVCVSSFNALTLSPALCSILLKEPSETKGVLGKGFKLFDRFLEAIKVKYLDWDSKLMLKIKRGMVFVLIMTIGLLFVGKAVPGGFIPEEDMGYAFINMQLPDASSMQRSDEIMKVIEEITIANENVEFTTVATGFSLLSGAMATNTGFVFVSFKDWDQRTATAKEAIQQLNAKLRTIQGAKVFAFGPPAIPGLGSGSGFSFFVQDKGGNSVDYLAQNTLGVIAKLNERPEIGRAMTTFTPSVPQKKLNVDKEKALKMGLSLSEVYQTVGAFLGGAYVNDFTRFGRLYKTYVKAESEYTLDERGLHDFFIKNNKGDMVPLSSFVTVDNVTGPEYTNRFNLFRSIEITGVPAPGFTSTQAMQAIREVVAETLPADMGFAWSNMSYQEDKASGSLLVTIGFSLFLVFLILAAQYESWSLPIAILLGTPFAIFGALLGLLIGRYISPVYELNIFAQISLVMLIGMAAKNAILIVEFASEEFKNGASLVEAAATAAKERFRAIQMTAYSFLLGVFPLILSTGTGSQSRQVMGMALFTGMLIATILGLFFYPMFYVLIGRIFGYEKKRDLEKSMEEE